MRFAVPVVVLGLAATAAAFPSPVSASGARGLSLEARDPGLICTSFPNCRRSVAKPVTGTPRLETRDPKTIWTQIGEHYKKRINAVKQKAVDLRLIGGKKPDPNAAPPGTPPGTPPAPDPAAQAATLPQPQPQPNAYAGYAAPPQSNGGYAANPYAAYTPQPQSAGYPATGYPPTAYSPQPAQAKRSLSLVARATIWTEMGRNYKSRWQSFKQKSRKVGVKLGVVGEKKPDPKPAPPPGTPPGTPPAPAPAPDPAAQPQPIPQPQPQPNPNPYAYAADPYAAYGGYAPQAAGYPATGPQPGQAKRSLSLETRDPMTIWTQLGNRYKTQLNAVKQKAVDLRLIGGKKPDPKAAPPGTPPGTPAPDPAAQPATLPQPQPVPQPQSYGYAPSPNGYTTPQPQYAYGAGAGYPQPTAKAKRSLSLTVRHPHFCMPQGKCRRSLMEPVGEASRLVARDPKSIFNKIKDKWSSFKSKLPWNQSQPQPDPAATQPAPAPDPAPAPAPAPAPTAAPPGYTWYAGSPGVPAGWYESPKARRIKRSLVRRSGLIDKFTNLLAKIKGIGGGGGGGTTPPPTPDPTPAPAPAPVPAPVPAPMPMPAPSPYTSGYGYPYTPNAYAQTAATAPTSLAQTPPAPPQDKSRETPREKGHHGRQVWSHHHPVDDASKTPKPLPK